MTHSSDGEAALTRVVLLGDHDTAAHCTELAEDAAKHGCVIANAFGFPEGAAAGTDDLAELAAVVAALGRAIAGRMDVWVPLPGPDFIREQHLRRLSLVLQRHGLNLRLTRNLYPVQTDGGFNEIDYALRREVQAVDDLDRAVLAAEGVKSLSREIETVLAGNRPAAAVRRADSGALAAAGEPPAAAGNAEPGLPPSLPTPTVPWAERKPLLKQYARWLVYGCGVTQAATARVLNSAGQRTPTGRAWQPATVSKLLNGAYDRAAADGGRR